MSKSHTLLTKVRQNVYNLVVSWTTVVLKDTGDGTEIWALNADRKPELVTIAERDFLVVAAEIESGHCDPLEAFLTAVDEILEERADYEQCQAEIAAENAAERYLENQMWAEYEAFNNYERSMGLV